MQLAQILPLVFLIFRMYYLVLFARIIFSWLRLPSNHPVMRTVGPVIYGLTEPLLRPIRNALRPYQGSMPLDFSPLLLYLGLEMIRALLVRMMM